MHFVFLKIYYLKKGLLIGLNTKCRIKRRREGLVQRLISCGGCQRSGPGVQGNSGKIDDEQLYAENNNSEVRPLTEVPHPLYS